MNTKLRTLRLLVPAMLIGLFGVLGCERADRVAGPEVEATVEEAYQDLEAPQFATVKQLRSGFTVVKGDAGDGEIRQTIGSSGGVLYLGRHMLVIPRRAVSGPTEFVMKPVKDGSIHVDLTATSPGGSLNDVGAKGFERPLWLYLSYAGAEGVPANEQDLLIAWLQANGEYEPMPSYVNTRYDFVIGLIQHFSGYIIVAN